METGATTSDRKRSGRCRRRSAWPGDGEVGGVTGCRPHAPEVAKFIPGWNQIRLDSRAMVFTMIAGIIAGIISGLLPAFQGARLDVNEL